LTENQSLYEVLWYAYLKTFSISSDYARYKAQEIAALASMGLISTRCGPRKYGRTWRVTEEGIETLRIEGYL
jgi:hypothetical protein